MDSVLNLIMICFNMMCMNLRKLLGGYERDLRNSCLFFFLMILVILLDGVSWNFGDCKIVIWFNVIYWKMFVLFYDVFDFNEKWGSCLK